VRDRGIWTLWEEGFTLSPDHREIPHPRICRKGEEFPGKVPRRGAIGKRIGRGPLFLGAAVGEIRSGRRERGRKGISKSRKVATTVDVQEQEPEIPRLGGSDNERAEKGTTSS